MPHHEYTIETQAKIKALEAVIQQQAKEIEALRAVLKEADDYLSNDRFNEIGSGSILHRQMQEALTGQ